MGTAANATEATKRETTAAMSAANRLRIEILHCEEFCFRKIT
jgi:hypothetical protein